MIIVPYVYISYYIIDNQVNGFHRGIETFNLIDPLGSAF